jgi:hypothetical protein
MLQKRVKLDKKLNINIFCDIREDNSIFILRLNI